MYGVEHGHNAPVLDDSDSDTGVQKCMVRNLSQDDLDRKLMGLSRDSDLDRDVQKGIQTRTQTQDDIDLKIMGLEQSKDSDLDVEVQIKNVRMDVDVMYDGVGKVECACLDVCMCVCMYVRHV
jgi:hypothetical protein